MGGEWHLHFNRPIDSNFIGFKIGHLILFFGFALTILATWGIFIILKALGEAKTERDERRMIDEKRRLMEAVVTSATDGVIITRADQIDHPGPEIIYVNQAQLRITGYEAHEIIGQSPRIFQSNHVDRTILDNIKSALREGLAFRGELLNRTKSGKEYWIDLSIVPVRNDQGVITHFASLQRDITEQRQQQAKLHDVTQQAEASARLKSEFLATMSHEIRTPLNGIIGMTNLILGSQLDYEQRHQAETTLHSAETLLHLLNDILDFSKIEAGKLDIENIGFNLPHLVEELVDMMAPQARRKGIELLMRIDQNVPQYIASDPARLRQILFNLVGNAIKFTEKGFVRIDISETPDFTLSPEQTRLRIAVTDTGIGIKADKLDLIFGKFSQADSSTTREYGGSGLGLAICKQLSQLMGGSIGVESKVNAGSTFWFTIIAELANQQDLPDDTNKASNQFRNNPPIQLTDYHFDGASILLAEDNPVNAMVFTQALEKMGCLVTHVTDGQQALMTASTGHFDLILLDCQMPVLDGYSAAGSLREDMTKGLLKSIPIIALTANAMKGDREKCLTAGMNDYLTKPLNFESLVKTMARWLKKDETGFSANSPLTTTQEINWAAFDECADILGDAMPEMVGRFLTSVAGYIDKIADSYEKQDAVGINKASHPLRSSAAQIGAQRVSIIAEAIEMLTLTDRPPDWPTIQFEMEKLLPDLKQSFQTTNSHLRERAKNMDS